MINANTEVALLAEGVGRNIIASKAGGMIEMSPSSRRAWVEIHFAGKLYLDRRVALLAEGVGRNGLPLPLVPVPV